MLKWKFILCVAVAASAIAPARGADSPNVRLWPADVHSKIFADSQPSDAGPIVMKAARNEYESAQIGVLADADAVVKFSATDLTNDADPSKIIPAAAVRLRVVDTVRVTKNTTDAENIVVRKAPFDCPDILRDADEISLTSGAARAIWVTVFVPENATSGAYSGEIIVGEGEGAARIPAKLEIFNFTLPSERHLFATNWFNPVNFATYDDVPLWSEEYWALLEKYMVNMAEHRQNVIQVRWAPDGSFVKASRSADGEWSIDFSNLERFLTLAEKCGVADRFEFSHVGGVNRENHTIDVDSARVYDEKIGEIVWLPFTEWVEPVLGALEKYLVETNRVDRAMIHVADEPFQPDMPAWRKVSEEIHRIAPRIKRIDAIESIFFTDALEIWVPKLSHYDRWRDAYRSQLRSDDELWFYICCHPFGEKYPNRFMDLPGSRIRAIHWLNYAENLTGYLHWGYNYWQGDAFGPPSESWAPGDSHVVYPGTLDSIRWELERESLEDFEYFTLLDNLTREALATAETTPLWADAKARSRELVKRAVAGPADVTLDAKVFEETRLELAREIERAAGPGPRLIVRTFPEDGGILTNGPTVVEIYGMTTPGAEVDVNGKAAAVADDGTFEAPVELWNTAPEELVITATLNGATAQTTRRFKKN
ncbi:MAG: DUF4091 domain-containing protein [Thermoguttaceae bacterium]|nr:DUF4091 domain-containing protein [Thermoguttaceae bacterium]